MGNKSSSKKRQANEYKDGSNLQSAESESQDRQNDAEECRGKLVQ